MIRLSILGLLFIVAICCVAPAMAAAAPVTVAPAAQVTLTADPFLTAATVTTSIYEVLKCPCTIIGSCSQVGEDCATPAGCCHCSNPIPNVWKCVGNP